MQALGDSLQQNKISQSALYLTELFWNFMVIKLAGQRFTLLIRTKPLRMQSLVLSLHRFVKDIAPSDLLLRTMNNSRLPSLLISSPRLTQRAWRMN